MDDRHCCGSCRCQARAVSGLLDGCDRSVPAQGEIGCGDSQVAKKLGKSSEHLEAAARSIMTTDTVPKIVTRKLTSGGKTWTVTGICKGAAMIAPNMATMLSVIMTDAALTPSEADTLLRHGVDRSFNCISVDGHMSTSDTVLLLANGLAGPIPKELTAQLQSTVDDVAMALAQLIIRDAEGASHFVTIDVQGCRPARRPSRSRRPWRTVPSSRQPSPAMTRTGAGSFRQLGMRGFRSKRKTAR